MLLQAATHLPLELHILDPDPNAPCRPFCQHFTVGDFRDADTVFAFGKACDVVTIEIEHVSVEGLVALEAAGVIVAPSASVVACIQDKGVQKAFLQDNNYPTAPFVLLPDGRAVQQYLAQHPGAWVQKLRKGGFDGRGVAVLAGPDAELKIMDAPSVVEDAVDIELEISVVVARSQTGDLRAYPPVGMGFHPEANLVDYLFAPVELPAPILAQAEALATQLAHHLQIVGVLAVEFFYTKNGQLLINEMACRVHNSGHHSIEANYTSQFEQHLRAVLGLPLGPTGLRSAAVMMNLVGASGHSGPVVYSGLAQAMAFEKVFVHLYGKAETRPFRKMGHLTALGDTVSQAEANARAAVATLHIIASQ
jgi:5-(carboxyamino)imidazole ribonucleotide synthase